MSGQVKDLILNGVDGYLTNDSLIKDRIKDTRFWCMHNGYW